MGHLDPCQKYSWCMSERGQSVLKQGGWDLPCTFAAENLPDKPRDPLMVSSRLRGLLRQHRYKGLCVKSLQPMLDIPYGMFATPEEVVRLYRPCWRDQDWAVSRLGANIVDASSGKCSFLIFPVRWPREILSHTPPPPSPPLFRI